MARNTSYENAATLVQEKIQEAQEKVLEAIRVGQEVTVSAVRDVAESYTPKLPDLSVLPSFETVIDFMEKMWESQRDFNKGLYEAIAPIGRSTFGAAKDAAESAKSAADHAKPAPEHTPRSTAKA